MGITSVLGFWSPVFKAVSMSGKQEEQGKYCDWFEGLNGVGSLNLRLPGAVGVLPRLASPTQTAALAGVYIFYTCASLISVLMVAFMYKPELEAVQAEAESGPLKRRPTKASAKEILAVLKMPKVWLFSLMVMAVMGFMPAAAI